MLLDDILFNLKEYSKENACKHDKQYSYKDLYELVCKTYTLLKDAPNDKPVVVYGHKEVYMIASFLACSFLGIAYVPIDKMMSKDRLEYILNLTKPSYIIGDLNLDNYKSISFEQIEKVSNCFDIEKIDMKPDDIYYVIFTSGTTGVPKGVMVTYDNLDSCINWLKKETNFTEFKSNYTIYNQAIFSFDLSVADIYLSLAVGCNHHIGKDVSVLEFVDLIKDLKDSKANMMVLTPSFAELLCTDSNFNQKIIDSLELIIFCGERLTKKLVDKLYNRFPNVRIINMYGPTECTYAVTCFEVPKNCDDNVPIGFPKDDVDIYIVDENSNVLDDGTIGEILITGKSVAKGYINDPNNKNFGTFNDKKCYYTGDLGYYKDGVLYYVSRKDSQIKYKGYRIELDDIEKNIAKIDLVNDVKVKVEKDEDGIVKRIVAYVVLKDKAMLEALKEQMLKILPKYMIPKIIIVDEIPLNNNGKKSI